MTAPQCHICCATDDIVHGVTDPSLRFCTDWVECNFRARRRLGMPLVVCLEWKARDLETIAVKYVAIADEARGRAAKILAAEPARTTDEYRAHLRSSAWETFRDEQVLAARYRCEDCGKVMPDLQVHHFSYDRLGQERPVDVLVLCALCHPKWDGARRAYYARTKLWRGATAEMIYGEVLSPGVRRNMEERLARFAPSDLLHVPLGAPEGAV